MTSMSETVVFAVEVEGKRSFSGSDPIKCRNREVLPAPVVPTAGWGTVEVAGDAEGVVLVPSVGGPSVGPGRVAVGTYAVHATFGGESIRTGVMIHVIADERVMLRCATRVRNCAIER